MADSIREQVLQRLKTTLETITAGNGYNFSPTVHRSRAEHFQSAVPFIVIVDAAESAEINHYGGVDRTMAVAVPYFAEEEDGVDWSVTADKMLSDVMKVIGTDHDLNGLAQWVNYTGHEIDYPEENSMIIQVTPTLEIMYQTDAHDPYTQFGV